MPINVRLLALHGFGGTFGSTAGCSTLEDIRNALAARGIECDIVAPKAPNATVHGPAWLAGDQTALGEMVGFAVTDAILAREGKDSGTPRPLLPSDLPAVDPACPVANIWHGVAGFEVSIVTRVNARARDGVKVSLESLELEWSGGGFDGVLGFSQGAMTAAMLCAHLERMRVHLPSLCPRFAAAKNKHALRSSASMGRGPMASTREPRSAAGPQAY